MTTPSTSTPSTTSLAGVPRRRPLRLRMGRTMGVDRLDGAWWPQSRDLAVELADLVDHFPAECGRVVRALFSPPDWDPVPRRVPVSTGYVKVGSFPRDDTHVIELKTSDRTVLHVLVVPPWVRRGSGSRGSPRRRDARQHAHGVRGAGARHRTPGHRSCWPLEGRRGLVAGSEPARALLPDHLDQRLTSRSLSDLRRTSARRGARRTCPGPAAPSRTWGASAARAASREGPRGRRRTELPGRGRWR